MTPTLVHRYAFPIREAVEMLLGDDAGDCEAWRVRVEGDELIVDVVAPVLKGQTIEVPADFDHDLLCEMIERGEFKRASATMDAKRVSMDATPSVEPSEQDLDSLKEPRFENGQNEPSDAAKPLETKASDHDSLLEKSAPEKAGRKGGALAKRAGILSNERGFMTFLGVKTSEEAADRIRHECAIDSRADLDHDERAASCFHDLDGRYKLWLEGYD